MKRLAIIIPFFGKDLKGGAEQHADQVATRLAARGHDIEILTTCCRSFQDDWAVNHLPSGVKQENGIKVRRFPVDKRNREAFDRVNGLMLNLNKNYFKPGVCPVSLADSEVFASENINSKKLLEFLAKNHQSYQAFIFIPYLYGVILNVLPTVADKAFLQPCLHDEIYAYLPQVENIFHAAKKLLFISKGEAELAYRLYGSGILSKSIVVGAGVEVDLLTESKTTTIINNVNIQSINFVICLGRRDKTKNTDLLIRAFKKFKCLYPNSQLHLLLAGVGDLKKLELNLEIPHLIDLGLISEKEKANLLAHCQALFQPSQNESYSRVIMEAWFYQRPVAVHEKCLATSMAVKDAEGGYLATTEEEWTNVFLQIDQSTETELLELGKKGQIYAQENAVWDQVIERYEKALSLPQKQNITKINYQFKKPKEIHQILPNLSYGDAISNQAIMIRNYLRQLGYQSDIFVRYVDYSLINEVKIILNEKPNPKSRLIYHHSISCSEITECVIDHYSPKCLIYHNITPSEFFEPYNVKLSRLLSQGSQELKSFANQFSISVGASAYNVFELEALGFKNSQVLPIIVDPQKWDIPADPTLMRKLQDGKNNIIFVGRIAPNKKQDDLVKAFADYLTIDADARLILIGQGNNNDAYYCHLLRTIEQLKLTHYVTLTGKIDDHQLLAYYRTANLYWSMSEHEGFGVPLVEAMWFNVPVLAYKSSAIPETLGKAGLIFNTKENFVEIAALAKLLIHDQDLRTKVINAQTKRRNDFSPSTIYPKIDDLIMKIEELTP